MRPLSLVTIPGVVLLLASCDAQSPYALDAQCHAQQALNVCSGPATLSGVDVSKWDGAVDWAKVKASGQAFAIARVSDGLTWPDATFAPNWRAMKTQGLVRGAYQFFRPGQDAAAQADFLLAQLAAAGGLGASDLPVVLDIETADGQSNARVRAAMQLWLDRVQAATGRRPMIYTAAFMSAVIGTGFSDYPLWVANYGATCPVMPATWSKWVIWQHADDGRVPGIESAVDLNTFNGSAADLLAFNRSTVIDAGPAPDAGTAPTITPADAGTSGAGATDAGTSSAVEATDAGEPTTTPEVAAPDHPAAAGAPPVEASCSP